MFEAAGAAMAALLLASPGPVDAPEHRAGFREVLCFAIKGVLIAAGSTPNKYRGSAIPGGQVFPSSASGPRLYLVAAGSTPDQ